MITLTRLWRRGVSFAVAALGTIAIGLVVYRTQSVVPVIRDILGDGLWAMMMLWLVSMVAPRTPPWKRATIALAICWIVEFSQLLHVPLIDRWRATTLGHLTLGTGFDPRDLAAYGLGIFAALVLESLFSRAFGRSSASDPA